MSDPTSFENFRLFYSFQQKTNNPNDGYKTKCAGDVRSQTEASMKMKRKNCGDLDKSYQTRLHKNGDDGLHDGNGNDEHINSFDNNEFMAFTSSVKL